MMYLFHRESEPGVDPDGTPFFTFQAGCTCYTCGVNRERARGMYRLKFTSIGERISGYRQQLRFLSEEAFDWEQAPLERARAAGFLAYLSAAASAALENWRPLDDEPVQ